MKSERTLSWIWKNSKSQIPLLTLLSILSAVSSVSYIALAFISRKIINIAAYAQNITSVKTELIYCGIGLLCVILAQLVLTYLNNWLRIIIAGRLEIKLRSHLFETVMKKKYPEISSLHSGEILNRFTSDIDIIVAGVTGFLPQALSIIAKLISGIIVILSFSKGYTAVLLIIGFLVMGIAMVLSPLFKKFHKEVQTSSGKMRSFSQECFENVVVVKSFANHKPLISKLYNHLNDLYRKKVKKGHLNNAAGAGIFLVFTIMYYLTLVYGAFEMAANNMDYGTLMAFLQIVSQIRTPFYNASGLITQAYSALASAERIMEIEKFNDDPQENSLDFASVYKDMSAICAENLSFGYDDNEIIKNSSFNIKKGSTVAVIGASGAGKSTLFKLLLGLFTAKDGSLYIKTENQKINIDASLRHLFAYVPQGDLVLSGTIAENLKFSNPDISDDEMIAAAKCARAYDFINSLPNGFETVIGERGHGLSEGQIQRISIARALLADKPILLLDECTSALDEQTEKDLLNNIANLKTKTVLFISHREQTLSICDTVLRIENGTFSIE